MADPQATGSRAADSDWWARVIDRWGVGVAIQLAQRHAQRGATKIPDYTEWRRERHSMPPWGETRPTTTYEVFWW